WSSRAWLLVVVEEVDAELEGDWASVIGSAQVEQLRGCRARVLRATNGGEFPPPRRPLLRVVRPKSHSVGRVAPPIIPA
ncbi:MAG: hypothetical protein QOE15_2484, partial [Acidimicrobiaceae bacterium]|nr:hypothetical protein [Acidimicrobiaceae bacterium]